MKSKIIQYGLQLSSKKDIMLSTLFYMNDLYKTHFVFVDSMKKRFYKTCFKNYPIRYLIWNHKYYTLEDSIDQLYTEDIIDNSMITKDLKSMNPYQLYLSAIGNYKIDELREIATKYHILLKDNGKNKVKQVLYNEINNYKLNN